MPQSVVKLFRSIPVSEAAQLHSIRHGLQVAEDLNEAFKMDFQEIRDWLIAFKTTVLRSIDDLTSRLDEIERRVNLSSGLLSAASRASIPEENSLSIQLANDIPDQDDVDHIE